MKFSTTPANLKPALTTVSRIAPTKSSTPILSGILFDAAASNATTSNATGDKLTLSATDLEQSIRGSVDGVEILEPGRTVIPKRITEVLSKLPQHNPVVFEVDSDNRRLTIQYGDFKKPSSFSMGVFNADEFPALPEVEGIKFKMDFDPRRITFAAADAREAVIVTQAVHFDLEGGYVVSTNGRQLATQKIESIPGAGNYNVLPSFLSRLSLGTELIFSKSIVFAENEGFTYTCRLIQGKYVNYKQLFRSEFTTTARVNTGELKDTLERARLITEFIPLKFSGITLDIVTKTESGAISETLVADIEGDEITVILNIQHLLNFLRYAPDEIVFKFIGPLNPVYIMPGEEWQGIMVPANPKREGA